MALQWIKANRQASLIGGLLGLLLLVFLVALLVRRRKNTDKAKRSGQPLAQPKKSADVAMTSPVVAASTSSPSLDTSSKSLAHESNARAGESDLKPVAAPANGVKPAGIQQNAEPAKLVPEQGFITNKTQLAAVAPNRAWVPTGPSSGSSADEDQEREVFEL